MKPNMQVDVRGRVRNTIVPVTNPLLPLFEAIVNGIHATTERFGNDVSSRGEIEVKVHRVEQADLPGLPGRPSVADVGGFEVADNGTGFTEKNMEAFCTADTIAKADRGGKGVGRFSWLVVFARAKVASVYQDESGRRMSRKFVFEPQNRTFYRPVG